MAALRLGKAKEPDACCYRCHQPRRFKATSRGDSGHGIMASQPVRKDAKTLAALDLNCRAPKSITLQAPIGGDERLIQANDNDVWQ